MKPATKRSATFTIALILWSGAIAISRICPANAQSTSIIAGSQSNASTNSLACAAVDTVWATLWDFNGLRSSLGAADLLQHADGTALPFQPGIVGIAYCFGSGSQYLQSVYGRVSLGVFSNLTVEAWIKPANVSMDQVILEWADDFGHYGVRVSIDSAGAFCAALPDVSGAEHSIKSPVSVLTLGIWQHIAMTYDSESGVTRLYRNGECVASQALGSFTPQTSYKLIVGKSPWSGPSSVGYQGCIDELGIYRRALTPSEITSIYQAGAAGKCQQGFAPRFMNATNSEFVATPGTMVTLMPVITGSEQLSYQWRRSGTNIPGAYAPSYVISYFNTNAQGDYSLVVRNDHGQAVGYTTSLILGFKPSIIQQPASISLPVGRTAFFNVKAEGSSPLRYAWIRNGSYLSDATNSSLVISNVTMSDTGRYWVRISNSLGTTFSAEALLTVFENQGPCVAAPNGLAAWWRAESNGMDQSGMLPADTRDVSFALGKVGMAFNFDGIRNTVTPQYRRGITNVLNNYTYELWAKPTAARNSTPQTSVGITGNRGQRYAIFPASGALGPVGSGISIGTNGISVFEHGSLYLASLLVANFTNSDWMHVAVVYSNGQPSLYVNGTFVRTGMTSTRPSFPSTCLGMDNDMPADYGHYAGLLDEVTIYSRSLSAEEVRSIYNAGAAGKCPSSAGDWPFIVEQPVSLVVTQGQPSRFSVTASGTAPLYYLCLFRNVLGFFH